MTEAEPIPSKHCFEAEAERAVKLTAALRQARQNSASQFVFWERFQQRKAMVRPDYGEELIREAVRNISREEIRQAKRLLTQYYQPTDPKPENTQTGT